MFTDDNRVIEVTRNPPDNYRWDKMFEWYPVLHESLEDGSITIKHVAYHQQLATLFAEPQDNQRFFFIRRSLGICMV